MYWDSRTPCDDALKAFGAAFMEVIGREGSVNEAFNHAKAAASLIAVEDRAQAGRNVTLEFGDPDDTRALQSWR